MQTAKLRPSPLTVALVGVISAVAVVGFAYTKHSADAQEQALLESATAQAALYSGSVFSSLGGELDSLAAAVSLSSDPRAVFAARAKLLATGPVTFVLSHERSDGTYVVDSEAGSGFSAGQVLGPALSSTFARAGSKLTPAPASFDGRTTTVGFAVGPPLVPAGTALYMQLNFNPFLPSQATAGKAFADLTAALYGAPSAQSGSLVAATTHSLPVVGRTAVAHTTIGAGTWTLVAAARAPLTGDVAHAAPFIILGLGLFIAALVGLTTEVLERRQRYSARLVADRTADLKQSLADLRDAQVALVRGERLTAVGEMASVVGHELRNPLAAVTNSLFLLRQALGEPAEARIEKHLVMAERETAKAASLAEDLTAFVRPRQPHKEVVELDEVVREVAEVTPAPPGVQLIVEVQPLTVLVDRRQMSEVLTNLLTNAYQALGADGGQVRIRVRSDDAGTTLAVEDNGPGISPEMADRAFEPFYTTKHDGTGLGLAIVRRLVEAHGGEVAFEAPGERGARAVVRLPAAATVVQADMVRS